MPDITLKAGITKDRSSTALKLRPFRFRAGVLDYKTALDMTEYIKHEREYVPWVITLRSLAYIGTMLSSRSSFDLYQVIITPQIFIFLLITTAEKLSCKYFC